MELRDVLALLERAVEAAGSQTAWAEAHKVSPQYVSDVLRRRRDPGESILDGLGLERVVTYRQRTGNP